MAKRQQQQQWIVSRIRGPRAEYIGMVQAQSAEDAIRKTIEDYQISDPDQQARIAARPG